MNMAKGSILIADDEKDITQLLEYTLANEGYKVIKASDGQEALDKALEHIPEFIILDIMMPKMDGIEVCRNLRQNPDFSNTLIIILTARSEEYSEVAGFDAGADDYIVKPIKLRSLVKRLNAIKRRKFTPEFDTINLENLNIDRNRYLIIKDGKEIRLPKKEFELLYLLASHKNKVISREEILEKVWGEKVIVGGRTIDVHVRRIRQKIGNDFIHTIKGVGYKFLEN